MSATRDPDTQPIPRVRGGGGERRRALVALLILAVIAVGIVAIMVAVLGGSNGGPSAQSPDRFNGPPVTHIKNTPSHPNRLHHTGGPRNSQRTSQRTSQPPTSLSPSGPSNRHVSCPTSDPCALRDDIGDVLGALNSYRQHYGLGPVAGTVTPAAATCAATAASECPNGFHWEPVGRSGRQVIEKIAARGGSDFLLNPQLKRVQIGWAYVPASHSFYCALVAPGT